MICIILLKYVTKNDNFFCIYDIYTILYVIFAKNIIAIILIYDSYFLLLNNGIYSNCKFILIINY